MESKLSLFDNKPHTFKVRLMLGIVTALPFVMLLLAILSIYGWADKNSHHISIAKFVIAANLIIGTWNFACHYDATHNNIIDK